ncbi:integrator complex subunit 7-like [Lycorma delicatula]|uniref:integrator complex subunit 7-like n=1 Tax=Lycorma delicatula TaxID=130591 RepID=UPI003F510115
MVVLLAGYSGDRFLQESVSASLRSTKVGEQSEAIQHFIRLFENIPSSKLADVFRQGNNFLHLWRHHLYQQIKKHLDNISNYEFMQRIISSTDSNDLLKLLEYLSDPR